MRKLIILLTAVFIFSFGTEKSEQKFMDLGDFQLENGQIIEDCKIGYRTFGKINSEKSNVIIWPTWFGGTSEHVGGLIAPNKLLDGKGFYVIVIDALGNGVSSSPSNYKKDEFPIFTIHDLVETQHELLKKLDILHCYGAIGGSMGSFQVFEWLISYPDFFDKAITYVCSPRLTSADLLNIEFRIEMIETCQQKDVPENDIRKIYDMFNSLTARTPEYIAENIDRNEFSEYLKKFENNSPTIFTIDNRKSQLLAMRTHDITRNYNSSFQEVAKNLNIPLLIIVNETDHVVNPKSALEFSKYLNCETLILNNNRGHLGIGYEMERCAKAINGFLK